MATLRSHPLKQFAGSARMQVNRWRLRAAMTLIETTIVLMIAIAAMAAGANFYSDYLQNQANKATADQMNDLSRSFSKYLQDNYSTVLTDAAVTGTTEIALEDLQPEYISNQFVNRNPFGQEYVFAVRKPDPAINSLEAIIYTRGGEEIEPPQALTISQMLGAGGGFTLKGGNPNTVRATFDGFSLDLADYNANPQGTGKLVAALFLNDMGMIASDFLYRNRVPGRPELNTMNTAINMNGNNLDNAADINATGVMTSGSVETGMINASGSITAMIAVKNEECGSEQPGAMARTAAGEILACKDGFWKPVGGGTEGQYSFFMAAVCPDGWVRADGSNGTVDLRGAFIRSLDAGRGLDPGRALGSFQDSENKAHSHVGRTDEAGRHRHQTQITRWTGKPGMDDDKEEFSLESGYTDYAGEHTHTLTTDPSGGPESRPVNVALLACMKSF